jgi:hypothetical protein
VVGERPVRRPVSRSRPMIEKNCPEQPRPHPVVGETVELRIVAGWTLFAGGFVHRRHQAGPSSQMGGGREPRQPSNSCAINSASHLAINGCDPGVELAEVDGHVRRALHRLIHRLGGAVPGRPVRRANRELLRRRLRADVHVVEGGEERQVGGVRRWGVRAHGDLDGCGGAAAYVVDDACASLRSHQAEEAGVFATLRIVLPI